MTPTWAAKGGRRWCYYVSAVLAQGRGGEAGTIKRVSAPDVESAVVNALRGLNIFDAERRGDVSKSDLVKLSERIALHPDRIEIKLLHDAAMRRGGAVDLSVDWTRTPSRRRREIIGIGSGGPAEQRPMPETNRRTLITRLAQAHARLEQILRDPSASTEMIGAREKQTERSFRRTLSLAFVSPKVVAAVVEGKLPRGLHMTRMLDLPIDWLEQERALGLYL